MSTETFAVKNHSNNVTEVTIAGASLLFSYGTLVGVTRKGGTRFKTDKKHSSTTSKHLNAAGYRDADARSPEELESFAADAVSNALNTQD